MFVLATLPKDCFHLDFMPFDLDLFWDFFPNPDPFCPLFSLLVGKSKLFARVPTNWTSRKLARVLARVSMGGVLGRTLREGG